MNLKIWKWDLINTDIQILTMPENPTFLTVQSQYNLPCLWALIDADAPRKDYKFRIIGTGNQIEDTEYCPKFSGEYLGTYQLYGGQIVFHLFFLGEVE
jgi:hypothetical protein